MFLSFWTEYLGFLLIFVGSLVTLVIVFWLLTKPKKIIIEENEENNIEEITEDETIEEYEIADTSKDDYSEQEMPTIITYIADTHAEMEEGNEISSNLNDNEEVDPAERFKQQNIDQEKPSIKLNISIEEERRRKEEQKKLDIVEIIEKQIAKENELEDPDPNRRYHVIFNKEKNKWHVKREGNEAILKLLETQKEAIAFATIWALRNDTTVVVHRKDGVIRRHSL